MAHEGIDFVTASANKCLQAIPGISFVLGRRAALEALGVDWPAASTSTCTSTG